MKNSGKTHKRILNLLYRSFDTDLSKKKKLRLEKALNESKDLKDEKELIHSRRQAIADSAEKTFRPYFSDRVMAQIAAIEDQKEPLESFYDALFYGFKRLAVVGALIMIVLLFFNVFQGHIISVEEIFFTSDLVMEEILNLPIF
ncbi:hypothetical protein ACFLRX_05100 [Acidobacteriota bacterium]